jgi:DNA-binding MurR/RpiR family transcriptional regulator
MEPAATFNDRLKSCADRISPAELRVAHFFLENREEVLIASASALARQAGTSDATVVRTAKALGFAGMEDLRRTLVRELRENLSPASRMARTLSEVGSELGSALEVTLDIHQKSLEGLRRDITQAHFQSAVHAITSARRAFIFGIGPSAAMADYFTVQLGRFGIDAKSLTHTGLLLADDVQQFAKGDLLMIFAYGRVYREINVLLDQADRHGLTKILFSDTLGAKLRARVDLVLPVARGRADMLSMHTATLALIEALLVGVASEQPSKTIANLEQLNKVRTALAGKALALPTMQR